MISINANSQEIAYQRQQFQELLVLRGFPADVYQILRKTKDHETDPTVTFKPAIRTNILYEEYPAIKMLQSYGWYHEEEQFLPSVAYLPVSATVEQNGYQEEILLDVQKNMRIDVLYDRLSTEGKRSFEVNAVAGSGLQVFYYVVRLTPFRSLADPLVEGDENHKYLSVPGSRKVMPEAIPSSREIFDPFLDVLEHPILYPTFFRRVHVVYEPEVLTGD